MTFNKCKLFSFYPYRFPTDFAQRQGESAVILFGMTSSCPPETKFTVSINCNSQQIKVFARHTSINCYDLLGFSHKLTRWSQLQAIVIRAKSFAPDPDDEILFLVQGILENCNDASETQLFLLEQLRLLTVKAQGRRFSTLTVMKSLELYLSSRSCYRILRYTLALPHPTTLVAKLGRVGEVGTDKECAETIRTVFQSLSSSEKRCALLFDEMYIKASIRFRGGHLIGYAEDSPSELAKSLLVFMIKPMFGKPAFVCRLVPIFQLSPDFLRCLIVRITEIIIAEGGNLLCLISDNHPVNRSVYERFVPDQETPWLGIIPVGVSCVLLQDPVHLFKSLRNNWLTEKTGTLKIASDEEVLIGKWGDLVSLYDKECMNVAKLTKLTYKAVHPSAIDRQSVTHMVAVFNEKTVAALRISNATDTARLVEKVASLWNVLNIKRKGLHLRLNDPNRAPISDVNDPRLQELSDFAASVSTMSGGKGSTRVACLTTETKRAMSNTINGLIFLIRKLLTSDHSYVLPGIFQTDSLEGEFGIYRYFLIIGGCRTNDQLEIKQKEE